jgi:hypothetical protein
MKKTAAVIGATGVAGQQFLAALADHPLSPGTMALDIIDNVGAAKGAILVAEYLMHEGHI